MAKRYYDKAAMASPDGWLPVQLALYGLSAHSAWLRIAPQLPPSLKWLGHYFFAPPKPPGALQLPSTACIQAKRGWVDCIDVVRICSPDDVCTY